MKIAFISAHSFDTPGGVRTHILNLSRELEKYGHKTIIIAPKKGNKKTSFNNLPNLIEVGESLSLHMNGTINDISFFTNHKIYKILEKENIDILHFHNFFPFISTDVLLLSKAHKKVLTLHTLPAGLSKRILTDRNISNLCGLFNHSIFVSESQIDMFKSLKVPYTIIPNGINIDKAIQPRGLNSKTIELLYVGRTEPRKGLIYLIEAFRQISKKISDVNLHIVGGTSFKRFLKKYKIQDSQRRSIIWHGRVSDEELSTIRKKMDIYVSPATMGESFGIVLLEAMSDGIPVIAFNNEGYRTILKNKLAWGLVRNKDIDALARKILALIDNKDIYRELSRQGLKESQKYSWDSIAKRTLNVYKSI